MSCGSVHDAMAWAEHGFGKYERTDPTAASAFLQLACAATLVISTACTGIDTPILAAFMVAHVVNMRAKPSDRPFKIINLFGVERARQPQEECLRGSHPPGCLFADMLDLMTDDVKAYVQTIPHNNVERTRSSILSRPLRRQAWCVRHGKMCRVRRAHIHVAGVPCVNHSKLGKRTGFGGETNHVFYVWCRQRRDLKEAIWILENVPEMGIDEVRRVLGDLFFIDYIIFSPDALGWKTRRPRLYIMGVLKVVDEDLPRPPIPTTGALENTLLMLFQRQCQFGQSAYLIATEEEIEAELTWARTSCCHLSNYQD